VVEGRATIQPTVAATDQARRAREPRLSHRAHSYDRAGLRAAAATLLDSQRSRGDAAPSAVRHRVRHGRAALPAAHPHPRAGGRGAGPRAGANNESRPACRRSEPVWNPKVSPGATAPRACRLRVSVPAKWAALEYRTPSAPRRALPIRPPGGRGDGQRRRRGANSGRGMRVIVTHSGWVTGLAQQAYADFPPRRQSARN